MAKEASRYIVVLEGNGGERSNYAGIRTFTDFANEAEFKAWWDEADIRDTILGQGVSYDEAKRLVQETSIVDRTRAALQEATIHGELDPRLAAFHLGNVDIVMSDKDDAPSPLLN